jgi:uncharacterized protein YcbX
MTITLSAINLYPVKSLRGISLQSSFLGLPGLSHDRTWMAVKPDGSFLTQRTHPQMALVETSIENERLVLGCFGMEAHTVATTTADMARCKTSVWGDAVHALDVGDETADWLSQAIGEDCRLVAFPSSETRQCDPSVSKPGDHTRFADAFPLLLISEASLEDLNGRLAQPVTMDRFRPNIVVSGCEAFAEDQWKNIRINGIPLRIVDACERCSVPTIDPTNGTLSGPEPIHTLSSYRQRDGEVYFGVNATPDAEGEISVGDTVVIENP